MTLILFLEFFYGNSLKVWGLDSIIPKDHLMLSWTEVFCNPQRARATVVAFANTNGGIILLGVDDNCHVVGFNKTSPEQLTNLIEGNLDPKPRFTIKQWQIDSKPIFTVEVEEGDNKPYVHREKGAYVRTSSNDRSPTRPDLDAFYSNRSSRFGAFPH